MSEYDEYLQLLAERNRYAYDDTKTCLSHRRILKKLQHKGKREVCNRSFVVQCVEEVTVMVDGV